LEKDDSYRLLICLACGQQVKLCVHCDRGNIYCSSTCAAKRRRESVARAKRKYQKSFAGALRHAKSQMAYSGREKQKVTDQGSIEEVSDVIVLAVDEETSSRQPQLAELSIDE